MTARQRRHRMVQQQQVVLMVERDLSRIYGWPYKGVGVTAILLVLAGIATLIWYFGWALFWWLIKPGIFPDV